MFNEIAEAIDRQDYQTANQLLKELQEDESDNPWLMFYLARLDEVRGNLEIASQEYRDLLRKTTNPKVISQARQGINRITEIEHNQREIERAQRQDALAVAKTEPGSAEAGMLILEPIAGELKQAAAQKFSRIMEMDAYTARLQLPSRAWRLYRTGPMGDMKYYTETLREAEIPCFCTSVKKIKAINVYQVIYFESVTPYANLVYKSQKGKPEVITFSWSEVTARVEGLIPLFEECVEMDAKRKIQRKTKTLDYVQMCDLHLGEKKAIIRFCDQIYDFQQGFAFSERQQVSEGKNTNRDNWNHLINYFKKQLTDIPVFSQFTPFAEAAIDFQELLKLIEPHIDLLRREDTPWDAAFQLYSSLVLVKDD
jgi:hypothetical protein